MLIMATAADDGFVRPPLWFSNAIEAEPNETPLMLKIGMPIQKVEKFPDA